MRMTLIARSAGRFADADHVAGHELVRPVERDAVDDVPFVEPTSSIQTPSHGLEPGVRVDAKSSSSGMSFAGRGRR